MLFSEIGNDIPVFNQAELKKIKINDNHDMFEVPVQNENQRRRTIITGLKSLCNKMFEIHETGV